MLFSKIVVETMIEAWLKFNVINARSTAILRKTVG